jgi:hypothetical protein
MRSIVGSCFAIAVLGACALPGSTGDDWKRIEKEAKVVDQVAKRVELYGLVTASTPSLVNATEKDGTSPFEFKLERGAQAYYEDARRDVNAKEAFLGQSVSNTSLQATAAINPDVRAQVNREKSHAAVSASRNSTVQAKVDAAIEAEYQLALESAVDETDSAKSLQIRKEATDRYIERTNQAKSSTSPGATSALADSRTLIPNVSSATDESKLSFESPFSLLSKLGDQQPIVSNRSAIITAAGDNTVEGIFRVLGNPTEATEATGRSAFFGVTMISVTPGKRTRKKHAADITVTTQLVSRAVHASEVDGLEVLSTLDADVRARILCDSALESFERIRQCSRADVQGQPLVMGLNVFRSSAKALAGDLEKKDVGDAKVQYQRIPAELQGGIIELKLDPAFEGNDGVLVGSNGFASCSGNLESTNLVCEFAEDYAPMVSAVSPMTESQVMELGNSQRSRTQIALDIAAALERAGEKYAGRFFSEFAKQKQLDAVSRTPQNLVTGYSSGSMFGYQIGPGFTAIDDLDEKEPDVGLVLQRQSFPALLLFNIRNDVRRTKVFLVKRPNNLTQNDARGTTQVSGDVYYLAVMKPHVRLSQSWRWSPTKILWRPWNRLSEVERAKMMYDLQVSKDSPTSNSAMSFLRTRADGYRRLVGTTIAEVPIPEKSKKARVTEVVASKKVLDVGEDGKPIETDIQIRVKGVNLDVAGKSCIMESLSQAKPPKSPMSFAIDGAHSRLLTCGVRIRRDGAGAWKLSVGQNESDPNKLFADVLIFEVPPEKTPQKPEEKPVFRYEVSDMKGTSNYRVFAPSGLNAESSMGLVRDHVAPKPLEVECEAKCAGCCRAE